MGQVVNAADEKRLAFVRAHVNGGNGIRWRGLAPTTSELGTLANKLRSRCAFDDPSHATGHVEYRGRKLLFEVTDSALIVTATGQTLDPRSVARMRPMVELEKRRRAAERATNTEKDKRWER